MVKRILGALLAALLLFGLSACGEKRTVHCDYCGAEILIDADSNMEEDWIIYCEACNEELFGGTLVK